MSVVHAAAAGGHVQCVNLWLSVALDASDWTDKKGNTPLHTACGEGHEQVVLALLQAAAEPNPVNAKGRTPYDVARKGHHRSIVELLRSYGGRSGADVQRAAMERMMNIWGKFFENAVTFVAVGHRHNRGGGMGGGMGGGGYPGQASESNELRSSTRSTRRVRVPASAASAEYSTFRAEYHSPMVIYLDNDTAGGAAGGAAEGAIVEVELLTDPETGFQYTFDSRTGESEWVVPASEEEAGGGVGGEDGRRWDAVDDSTEAHQEGYVLAGGWELLPDPDSGCWYKFHEAQGESLWVTEEDDDAVWGEAESLGYVAASGSSSTVDVWEEGWDEDTGYTYYYNTVTGESVWEGEAVTSTTSTTSVGVKGSGEGWDANFQFTASTSTTTATVGGTGGDGGGGGSGDFALWERDVDETTGCAYLYDPSTGESVWEHDLEAADGGEIQTVTDAIGDGGAIGGGGGGGGGVGGLGDMSTSTAGRGWTLAMDEDSGCAYYYDEVGGDAFWISPTGETLPKVVDKGGGASGRGVGREGGSGGGSQRGGTASGMAGSFPSRLAWDEGITTRAAELAIVEHVGQNGGQHGGQHGGGQHVGGQQGSGGETQVVGQEHEQDQEQWEAMVDEASGYSYWYSHATGETQWAEDAESTPYK